MQNIFTFLHTFLCFSLIISANFSYGQTEKELLSEADSLFDNGKYTKSIEKYEKILTEQKRFTPQMLTRMAYINEAEGDIMEALYYLNLYYKYTADESVLQKMSELAEAKKLDGYKFTDYEYFSSVFHKNYSIILLISSLITLGLMIFIFIRKRQQESVIIPSVFVALLMGFYFWLFNFGFNKNNAIISNKAYVVASPSAGAKRMYQLNKGDRVEVTSKNDIWYKIKSGDNEVYIREGNLKVVGEK